jgi:hypothetical protein
MTNVVAAPREEILPPVDLDGLARKINLEHKAIVDAAKGVVPVFEVGNAVDLPQIAHPGTAWQFG